MIQCLPDSIRIWSLISSVVLILSRFDLWSVGIWSLISVFLVPSGFDHWSAVWFCFHQDLIMLLPLAFLLLTHLLPQQIQGHVIDLIVHRHHHQVEHIQYKTQALTFKGKGDAQNNSNCKMVESPRPPPCLKMVCAWSPPWPPCWVFKISNYSARFMTFWQEHEYEHLESCDPSPCHPMANCTPGFGAVAGSINIFRGVAPCINGTYSHSLVFHFKWKRSSPWGHILHYS